MIPLKDASLFKQQAFIDNRWTNADSGETIPVTQSVRRQPAGDCPFIERGRDRQSRGRCTAGL